MVQLVFSGIRNIIVQVRYYCCWTLFKTPPMVFIRTDIAAVPARFSPRTKSRIRMSRRTVTQRRLQFYSILCQTLFRSSVCDCCCCCSAVKYLNEPSKLRRYSNLLIFFPMLFYSNLFSILSRQNSEVVGHVSGIPDGEAPPPYLGAANSPGRRSEASIVARSRRAVLEGWALLWRVNASHIDDGLLSHILRGFLTSTDSI